MNASSVSIVVVVVVVDDVVAVGKKLFGIGLLQIQQKQCRCERQQR